MATPATSPAKNRLTLDEFLEKQLKPETPSLKATIQIIDKTSDQVRVTPWVAGVGCLCHLALDVPKVAIESVQTKGETDLCCGNTLMVAEISFKEGQHLRIEEVFEQLSKPMHVHKFAHGPKAGLSGHGTGVSIGQMPLSMPMALATSLPFAAGAVSFSVYNESSYQKTFNFIDDGNNGRATYNMAPGQTAPLALLRASSGYGSMHYNSNFQPGWTHVGFIKDGDTVNLY